MKKVLLTILLCISLLIPNNKKFISTENNIYLTNQNQIQKAEQELREVKYDKLIIFVVIGQVGFIGIIALIIILRKKKKEKEEIEKQNQSNNNIVFYTSYEQEKKEEIKEENKVEQPTPVFTSSSTFSTSGIVNGPTQSTTNDTNPTNQ